MHTLFRRGRGASTNDAELDSWLCDVRSHQSQRFSAAAAEAAAATTAAAAPPLAERRRLPPHRVEVTPVPSKDTITYFWDRRSGQALEVGRATAAAEAREPRWAVVHWRPCSETLGITVDVEATTRQLVVTRSSRHDIQVGSVVARIAGHEAREDNFRDLLLAAKLSPGITISLALAPAPAPIVVTKPSYELALLGIHAEAFELVAVDGRRVRYLSLPAIDRLIHANSAGTRICEMVFQRTHEASRDCHRAHSERAHADRGVATAMVGVAVLSSALV